MSSRIDCAFRLFLVLAAVAAATPALAVQRTFVASTGADTNPCTLTLPCRGFAAAVTAVGFNGEVVVLDSAGYGAVTIDKSVTIAGDNDAGRPEQQQQPGRALASSEHRSEPANERDGGDEGTSARAGAHEQER